MSYGSVLRRDEIDAFKAQWPCHGLPDALNSFYCEFSDDGDLIDYEARSRNGRALDVSAADSGALLALTQDAQRKVHPEHAAARER